MEMKMMEKKVTPAQRQDTQRTAQRRYPRSRRAKGEKIPWNSIRIAYITRPDKPSFSQLEREFGLGDKTVQKRGSREGWRKKREEHNVPGLGSWVSGKRRRETVGSRL